MTEAATFGAGGSAGRALPSPDTRFAREFVACEPARAVFFTAGPLGFADFAARRFPPGALDLAVGLDLAAAFFFALAATFAL